MNIQEINLNSAMSGNIVSKLMACGFNTNCLRPWIGADGRSYIAVNEGGKVVAKPVTNALATLRKEDWIQLDEAIIKAAQPRLRLVSDIRGAGLTYSLPNGLGTTVLQSEVMGDIGDATISMDGMREGANDRPEFNIVNLPLPIIHKDFSYSARQLATSRSGATPLDTTTAELAARKVAEEVEKLALGVASTYAFGGGTIYGLVNYPNTITTETVQDPTDSLWTPEVLVSDVLAMRQAANDKYFYGPYMLYMGSDWNQYLDEDYKALSTLTLRQRLGQIDGISDVRTLDFLTGSYKNAVLLVQMTPDVIRMVVGMELTTVQWESNGGMLQNFKVMCIMVPQLRADINSSTGIVYAAGNTDRV